MLLLENLRFHAGEEANDPALRQQLAALGDLYVNDAFSAAHRAHASTDALAHLLPAYAGEDMRRELEALDAALGHPERPVLGIVGGSKVSTKLDLLHNLVGKLDRLAIGGGMANTFLSPRAGRSARSYCEKDLADTARDIMRVAEPQPLRTAAAHRHRGRRTGRSRARRRGCAAWARSTTHERILDAGPETMERLCAGHGRGRRR